jgi:hypothetical protein
VTADLDGDQNLDFVLPTSGKDGSAGLLVFFGDGTGRDFPTSSASAFGSELRDLAIGDFNDDGMVDIAAAVGRSDDGAGLGIFINGGGVFVRPTLYPTEGDPSQVATGDFSGDGELDVAVTDNSSGNVDILLGLGRGRFGAPATFPATATPGGIVVSDFNEDGKLDLAISNYATMDVRILLGDGQGGFSTANIYLAGGNCSEVSAGDFNHDGHQDLAVSVFNLGSADHIGIFLGNGDGSFDVGASIPVGDPRGNAVVDMNGDGNLDIVAASYSDNNLTFALGDGSGGFATIGSFLLGQKLSQPLDVATADFNHDGIQDLVTIGHAHDYYAVLIGRPCQ